MNWAKGKQGNRLSHLPRQVLIAGYNRMITEEGKQAFSRLGLRTQARTLDMVSQGVRQVKIAHELGISSETVKQHLQRGRNILGVANTVALAAVVVQQGWIRVDSLAN